jgi:hypothetical protein
MYLSGTSNYLIDFSFMENEIIFKNFSGRNPETGDKEIIIPFGTDLTDLEEILTIIEMQK